MHVALAELTPERGAVEANLDRLERVVRAAGADLVVFPELYLSGYLLGDRLRTLALRAGDATFDRLGRLASAEHVTVVVGAPLASAARPGEVENVALIAAPDGAVQAVSKRYLPTFGPFEEGLVFTPSNTSAPVTVGGLCLGLEICYDAFFPEVARELALGGAELLVNISASPVTSRRLFEKLLPARSAENGLPLLYVNRAGVEDGMIFAGGSGAWDSRGEPLSATVLDPAGLQPDERLLSVEVDLNEAERWRPFRPVLRDVSARPPPSREQGSVPASSL
jgi:predicted amidohydrolase